MEIMNVVNKKIVLINGNLIQMIMYLAKNK